MSFISDNQAAAFLYFAGVTAIEVPYNATATGTISLNNLLGFIEEASGKLAKITPIGGEDKSHSPRVFL